MKQGKLYGVGVGPGDPRYLTLRAVEIIKTAEVIAYLKSHRNGESRVLDTIQDYISPEAKLLKLELPITGDDGFGQEDWETGAQAIIDELNQGRSVAFVTLEDPSLYSPYSYLLEYVKQRIPEEQIETVPGITAMSAVAARLNIPLAIGDEALVVVPGSEEAEYYLDFPNAVMLKVSQRLAQILEILEYRGKEAVLATRVGQTQEAINWRPRAQDYVDYQVDDMSMLFVKEELGKWVR